MLGEDVLVGGDGGLAVQDDELVIVEIEPDEPLLALVQKLWVR